VLFNSFFITSYVTAAIFQAKPSTTLELWLHTKALSLPIIICSLVFIMLKMADFDKPSVFIRRKKQNFLYKGGANICMTLYHIQDAIVIVVAH